MTPSEATKDGCDTQMQTNHLSQFIPTKELLPLVGAGAASSGDARIVFHSSSRVSAKIQYKERSREEVPATNGTSGSAVQTRATATEMLLPKVAVGVVIRSTIWTYAATNHHASVAAAFCPNGDDS